MKHSHIQSRILAALISWLVAFTVNGQTIIYAIKEDGTLWYYKYKGALNGTSEWEEPKQVGNGWQTVNSVFSSQGKIYAIKEDGTLWWYHHKGIADGSALWDDPKKVGTGWNDLKNVFSSNGKIYAVKNDGKLWWYDHTGAADGSFRWKEAKEVGRGWQDMTQVFDCDGKIYGVTKDGRLLWYNHKGAADGSFSWEGSKEVGHGWENLKEVFGVKGRIYVVKEDGTLWWYHHKGSVNGSFSWDEAKKIGEGWDQFIKVFPLLTDDLPESAAPASGVSPVIPGLANTVVLSAISIKYSDLGGLKGFPGKPLSKELPTSDGKGRYQKFEHCDIYWHPELGAFEVHGAIRDTYRNFKAEKDIGYPVTDQLTCSGDGRYNLFKKKMPNGTWAESAIYWSGKNGAWPIYGAIWQRWKADGAEKSVSGFPISAERGDKTFRSQNFQYRVINYTPSGGVVIKKPNVY